MAYSMSSSDEEQKNQRDDPNRERGLMYIIDKLERGGKVTGDDVRLFLSDLSLPLMTNQLLAKKFQAAAVPLTGISSIATFFVFIMNELKHHDSDDIIDAFKTFDHEITGFINAADLRQIVGNLGDILEMDEIDRVIEMSDVDGDGTINYEEVLKIVQTNEGHLDAAGVPVVEEKEEEKTAAEEEGIIMEKLAAGERYGISIYPIPSTQASNQATNQ